MKKFKLLTVIISFMMLLCMFAGCSLGGGSKHVCESKCEVCEKCTDLECEKAACKEKCECETEHTCESKCEVCEKCTNAECEEEACAEKCECEAETEHTCESVCEECGGCLNMACEEEACEIKCDCEAESEHTCESECEVCGGCLNEECEEEACLEKCECEAEPEHTCDSVCEECGGCLNEECEEEACAEKCECVELTAITVSGAKTEFAWGEEFSVGELSVTALYEDDSEEELFEGQYVVDASAFDATQAGTYTIKVTYKDKEATYDVTVADPELTGIRLNGYKDVFEYSEEFSFGGTVEAVYQDASATLLGEEEYEIDSTTFDSSVAGEYSIVVSMVGTEFTETYTVIVNPSKVASMVLGSYQTNYLVGTSVDFSGITATGTRENGETVALTAEDLTVDLGECDGTTLGTYEIKVSYKEDASVYVTFTIKVTDKRIRILAIGDSTMTESVVFEVPYILDELGYASEVARVYTNGDCTIDTHYTNATNAATSYYFKSFENGAWISESKKTLEYAITYSDWDVIMFQQEIGTSGLANSYENLGNLVSYVEEKATNEDVKFYFNMAWAYGAGYSEKWTNETDFTENYGNDQMTMYNAIVSAAQSEVVEKYALSIIPVGTAIQNARTSKLAEGAITSAECTLTKSKGYYMAALTVVSIVTGEDISNVQYMPANTANTTTKPEKQICIESVVNALANPYQVTNSTYVS